MLVCAVVEGALGVAIVPRDQLGHNGTTQTHFGRGVVIYAGCSVRVFDRYATEINDTKV